MKYKGIIFDLDQTLIDSSSIESLRKSRQWSKIMQNLHLLPQSSLIVTLIQKLALENVKIGIITNSPRMYAEAVLKALSIKYDSLVAYHDVSKIKPHPEPFNLMLKLLNLLPNECISVGDHDNDILASQRAGVSVIGVNWFSPSYNFSVTPNAVVSNITDFFTLLK